MLMRSPAKPKPRTAQTMTFPAPTKGWIANANLAKRVPDGAEYIENWFPTPTGARPRGGSQKHATIGYEDLTPLTGTVAIDETTTVTGTSTLFESELEVGQTIRIDGEDYVVDEIASDTSLTVTEATHDTVSGKTVSLVEFQAEAVESFIGYVNGSIEKMFAATETAIYDATNPANEDIAPTATVDGLTSGDWISTQFATSGGVFSISVNGADYGLLYDGVEFNESIPGGIHALEYSSATGLFAAGQTITGGTSGATALIHEVDGDDSAGTLYITNLSDDFEAETISTAHAAHTFTANGNAQIDTAESVFGGASGLFDGTGDWATASDHADFTLGDNDWTVDFRFNCTRPSGSVAGITGQRADSAASNTAFAIFRNSSGTITARASVGSTNFNVTSSTDFTDALNTGWHHFAFVRTGDVLRLFIDGNPEGGDVAITGSVNDVSADLFVGGLTGANGWQGWIDEFRLSVGIARWTETFTPPAAAYTSDRYTKVLLHFDGSDGSTTITDSSPVSATATGEQTPAVGGIGNGSISTQDFSFVWPYKQRLYFIEKNSLSAWYLGAAAIAGVPTELPLGGVFALGGSLLFGASWSLDESAGLAAYNVFVSSEGEAAVYKGADPGEADDWGLVGVYKIGRPLGKRAWFRGGGDLVIATDIGLVSLAMAMRRDVAALAPVAVSYPIEDEWNRLVRQRTGEWECRIWPTGQMVIVAPSRTSSQKKQQLVANAVTGAWAPFTGWDVNAMTVFRDRFYFGTTDGKVVRGDHTGADEGSPFTCSVIWRFDDCKNPASPKVTNLARAVFLTPYPVNEVVFIAHDRHLDLPTPPVATEKPVTGDVWGTAIWGEATWSESQDPETYEQAEWQSVCCSGYTIAPGIIVTSAGLTALNVEIARVDVMYELGEPVG